MKKLFGCLALLGLCINANAQTVKSQVVENGGSGVYPAIVVEDASLPTHTIYRPKDLKATVENQGKLPVIVYANGACFNNNVEMRLLLNEVASHGYLAIAIGPYDEESTVEQWKRVLFGNYPKGKDVVLATGERYPEPTAEQKEEARLAQEAARAAAEKAAKKKSKKPEPAPFRTYSKQLLEALDWITDQNADPQSEYYHMIDLDQVAAMGQSCGGAQVLGVSHDPRIKTCVMLNTGIGDMEMSGSSKENLKSVHTPMFYMIGGPTDIAHQNANKDFERLEVPVVMFNSHDGHNGTYYEQYGGAYAFVVTRWLDWQLKGITYKSALFLDDDFAKMQFPTWTFERKNF